MRQKVHKFPVNLINKLTLAGMLLPRATLLRGAGEGDFPSGSFHFCTPQAGHCCCQTNVWGAGQPLPLTPTVPARQVGDREGFCHLAQPREPCSTLPAAPSLRAPSPAPAHPGQRHRQGCGAGRREPGVLLVAAGDTSWPEVRGIITCLQVFFFFPEATRTRELHQHLAASPSPPRAAMRPRSHLPWRDSGLHGWACASPPRHKPMRVPAVTEPEAATFHGLSVWCMRRTPQAPLSTVQPQLCHRAPALGHRHPSAVLAPGAGARDPAGRAGMTPR